jgi:TPR repeat protein
MSHWHLRTGLNKIEFAQETKAMPIGIRCGLLALCALLATELPADAGRESFADLLSRAKAQAAEGHRWAPPGNNMTETIMTMLDVVGAATPEQLAELSALLENGKMAADNTAPPSKTGPGEDTRANTASAALPAAIEAAAPKAAESLAAPPAAGSVAAPAIAKTLTPPAAAGSAARPPTTAPAPAEAVSSAAVAETVAHPAVAETVYPPAVAETAYPPADAGSIALPPTTAPAAQTKTTLATAKTPAMPIVTDKPTRERSGQGALSQSAPGQIGTSQTMADPHRAGMLFARGVDAERLGDLSAARRFYTTAARQGDAAAARNLGRLYDPAYLRQTALGGVDPDPELARLWYNYAVRLGDSGAGRLLEALSSR